MEAHAEILLSGKKKVDINFEGFTLNTDLSVEFGGDNTALNPFQVFLSSIAACSGLFLKNYCDAQNISTDGMKMFQYFEFNDQAMLIKTVTEVQLPPSFPENKKKSLINALKACKVKKHMDPKIVSEVVLK